MPAAAALRRGKESPRDTVPLLAPSIAKRAAGMV
jgi:hypothetical protein